MLRRSTHRGQDCDRDRCHGRAQSDAAEHLPQGFAAAPPTHFFPGALPKVDSNQPGRETEAHKAADRSPGKPWGSGKTGSKLNEAVAGAERYSCEKDDRGGCDGELSHPCALVVHVMSVQ